MFPAPFEYADPTSIDEVVALLAKHGSEAKLLAGGQTLVAAMNLGLLQPGIVVDLNRVAGLDHLERRAGELVLGGLVRHHRLEHAAEVAATCPLLAEAATLIGNPRVRRRGTVGGSLAHADPAAELPAALLALGATFRLAGPGGSREVAVGDFFVDALTTALREDELLVEARVPIPAARTGWAFEELARRPGDFAVVGAVALVSLAEDGICREARLAFAGVGPGPVRARGAEAMLGGSRPDPARLVEAARTAVGEVEVESDALVSAAYRRHLVGVLAGRALEQAASRADRRDGAV